MHGLGNDFIVVDGIHQKIHFTAEQIRALSQRDTGIGFDQCLVVESSHHDDVDFFYRIYNANGNEIGQCGNGARCLARFVQHYGLTNKQIITVQTHTTCMTLQINQDKTVTVDMGLPKLLPKDIPIFAKQQSALYSIPLDDKTIDVHAVSVGNPHAVLVVANLNFDINEIGQRICEHPYFPEQTNVGFMHIVNPSFVHLRVYERGCGETKACGSGAVAAVVVGRLFHQLAEHVSVSLPGGILAVHWPSKDKGITLTGPATFVYEGKLGL